MTTTRTSEKGLTLPEAAEELRVPKKTLRHVLSRPDRKARLLHEYRTTKKGLVTVEIIPETLLDELAATLRSVAVPPEESMGESAAEVETSDESVEPSPDVTDSAVEDAPTTDQAPSDAPEEPEATSVVATPPLSFTAAPADAGQSTPGDARLIVATYERLLSDKDSRLADLRAALEAERENARRLAEALTREQETVAALTERVGAALDASSKRSWFARLFGG